MVQAGGARNVPSTQPLVLDLRKWSSQVGNPGRPLSLCDPSWTNRTKQKIFASFVNLVGYGETLESHWASISALMPNRLKGRLAGRQGREKRGSQQGGSQNQFPINIPKTFDKESIFSLSLSSCFHSFYSSHYQMCARRRKRKKDGAVLCTLNQPQIFKLIHVVNIIYTHTHNKKQFSSNLRSELQ